MEVEGQAEECADDGGAISDSEQSNAELKLSKSYLSSSNSLACMLKPQA